MTGRRGACGAMLIASDHPARGWDLAEKSGRERERERRKHKQKERKKESGRGEETHGRAYVRLSG